MSKYSSASIIEDKEGAEVCRQGDKVKVIDSEGTEVVGIIDEIDFEDGNKVILFKGWNTKVVIDYIKDIKILNDKWVF